MSGTCPRCRGIYRKLVSPGYFECTSPVVRGVVPVAGPGGSRVEQAVTGPCGNHYREGAAPTSGPKCACRRFAIGSCQTCGKALCGLHGSQAGGSFICNSHVAEARVKAAEDDRRTQARETEEAIEAVADEKRAVSEALGGFPEAPASGQELASALQRLVPARIVKLDGGKKTFGRKRIPGWCFLVSSEPNLENRDRFDLHHLMVARDGSTWLHRSTRMVSTDYQPLSVVMASPHGVEAEHLRRVRDQVFDWTGIAKPPGASARQHELVKQHEELLKYRARVDEGAQEMLADILRKHAP